jgi:hypothetical protein
MVCCQSSPAGNGRRSLDQIVVHMATDKLVARGLESRAGAQRCADVARRFCREGEGVGLERRLLPGRLAGRAFCYRSLCQVFSGEGFPQRELKSTDESPKNIRRMLDEIQDIGILFGCRWPRS